MNLQSHLGGSPPSGSDGDPRRTNTHASASRVLWSPVRAGRSWDPIRADENGGYSLHLGEDELGARLPGPLEHEIQRRPTSAADEHRRLVDDLCAVWPGLLDAVAVAA